MSSEAKTVNKNAQICKLCEPPTTHNSYYAWAKHRKEVHNVAPNSYTRKQATGLDGVIKSVREALKDAENEKVNLANRLKALDKTILQCKTILENHKDE